MVGFKYLDAQKFRIKHNGVYIYLDEGLFGQNIEGKIVWDRSYQGYLFIPDDPTKHKAVVPFAWQSQGVVVAKSFMRIIRNIPAPKYENTLWAITDKGEQHLKELEREIK